MPWKKIDQSSRRQVGTDQPVRQQRRAQSFLRGALEGKGVGHRQPAMNIDPVDRAERVAEPPLRGITRYQAAKAVMRRQVRRGRWSAMLLEICRACTDVIANSRKAHTD